MALNEQTLSTDFWVDARTILVAANLKTTNGTTAATTAASIKGVYNDEVPTRPIVIINPISDDKVQDKFSDYNGKTNINLIVDCYCKTGTFCDQIRDQVKYALERNPIGGMEPSSITTSPGFLELNGIKYHSITVNANYKRE